VLYDAYKRSYGRQDEPCLVVQADTRTMNPTIPQTLITKAYESDPMNAAAEYGAEFRSDISSFMNLDWIEQAMEPGCYERPPRPERDYISFCDPSGGAHDSFTLSIAHREEGNLVVDLVREYQPLFNPSAVVEELAQDLKRYHCHTVTGDRYAGEWTREAFRTHEIHYRHSDKTKSELYLEALPLFATGTVRILDHRRLMTQLLQLERRTHRSGKDSIDHPPQGHDDVANAVCGALVGLRQRGQVGFWFSDEEDEDEHEGMQNIIKDQISQQGWWVPG